MCLRDKSNTHKILARNSLDHNPLSTTTKVRDGIVTVDVGVQRRERQMDGVSSDSCKMVEFDSSGAELLFLILHSVNRGCK